MWTPIVNGASHERVNGSGTYSHDFGLGFAADQEWETEGLIDEPKVKADLGAVGW